MNRFESAYKPIKKYLAPGLLGIAALLGGASQAWAQELLGTAESFAVLSAAPAGGGAVTCTDSTITGDVGSSGGAASVVQTTCVLDGAIVAPVSEQVVTDFNDAYAALAAVDCDVTLMTGNLAGLTLDPGTYCVEAASTTTNGVLTLDGGPTDTWLFKIGTLGTGALTGTGFDVVMAGDAEACNVTWWVAEAATMTDSSFNGTILAGAAITFTRGDAESRALASAAVTLTGADFLGCEATGGRGLGKLKAKCNQGVGNGPEGCDPGNSNQGDPSRSNDELGGTPGDPGREGGN